MERFVSLDELEATHSEGASSGESLRSSVMSELGEEGLKKSRGDRDSVSGLGEKFGGKSHKILTLVLGATVLLGFFVLRKRKRV